MNAYVVLSEFHSPHTAGRPWVEGVYLTRESAEQRRRYLSVLSGYEHATVYVEKTYLEGPES